MHVLVTQNGNLTIEKGIKIFQLSVMTLTVLFHLGNGVLKVLRLRSLILALGRLR
jgi:hypothetical protein